MSDGLTSEKAVRNLIGDLDQFHDVLTDEKEKNPGFSTVVYGSGMQLCQYRSSLNELIQRWERLPNSKINDRHDEYCELNHLISLITKRSTEVCEGLKSIEARVSGLTKSSGDKVFRGIKLARITLNSELKCEQLIPRAGRTTEQWIMDSPAGAVMSFINKIMGADNHLPSDEMQNTKTAGESYLSTLISNMECQYDLVDYWEGRLVIKHGIQGIDFDKFSTDSNHAVLEYLQLTNIKQFLSALCKSNQQHLANFILAGGDQEKCSNNVWPMDNQKKDLMQEMHSNLVENINDKEMLHRLFSKSCISRFQMESVKNFKISQRCNRELMLLMMRRSILHFEIFCQLLNDPDCCNVGTICANVFERRLSNINASQ